MKKLMAIGFVFFAAFLLCEKADAQRINFSTWVGSNSITITPGSPSNLDFGSLLPGSAQQSISLTDNTAAVFEISAPAGYDISVWLSAPQELINTTNSSYTIPFALSFAYSNYGDSNVTTAKQDAVQLPSNYDLATFPILRSASGSPPAAPPAPPTGSTIRTTTNTAYLFIYGDIGPVSSSALAGTYNATVTINVDFANE